MKPAIFASATAASLVCCAILSCNTADPSAISEGQKALAEAMAKNQRLEEEIAGLKAELQEAKAALSKPSAPAAVPMPNFTEITSKLEKATAKLDEAAKNLEQVATKAAAAKTVEPAVTADVPQPPARPTRQSQPAVPEKPKPKYDIHFDNPVMGPGAR